jgi:hypothetical protein
MNETARFLGERAGWRGATLTLEDLHGLWGGWHIRVGGDGRMAARGVLPSAAQTQVQKRLSTEQVNLLFEACIQWDLVAIHFPLRDGYVPDETHTALVLQNGVGDLHKVVCWGNDPKHEGFEYLCELLRRLT